MPRRIIKARLFALIVTAGLLLQIGVPLTRIATTYKALSGGIEPYLVGVLSAVFTILPVLFTVTIGKLNDRGHIGSTLLAGSLLVAAATAFIWLSPATLVPLIIGTLVLGIAQTLGLAGLQFAATRVSSRYHRDSILGNYMMMMSLGGGLGPLFIGFVGSASEAVIAERLLTATTVLGFLSIIPGIFLLRSFREARTVGGRPPGGLAELARTRGVVTLLIASGLSVAAQDLVLVFTPVLGIERQISVAVVGYLIATRSLFSVVSRFFFGRLVRGLGRRLVVVGSMTMAAAGFALIVAPVPVWVLFAGMALIGMGVGVASTGTVSLMLVASQPRMHATALSLRLTANRIMQFAIPLAAAPIVAVGGVGGIFAVTAAVTLVSGISVHFRIGSDRPAARPHT